MKKQTGRIICGKITKTNKLHLPRMKVYTTDEMTEKQLMLYNACCKGNGTLIRDCLREDDLYTNILDAKNGRTLMHYTAERNLALSTKLLITKLKLEGFKNLGNVLNIQDADKNTPLHLALLNGKNEKLIRTLVEKGADIYIKNSNNKSALQLAQESNVVEIYDYFSRLNKKQIPRIPCIKQTNLDSFLVKRSYLE